MNRILKNSGWLIFIQLFALAPQIFFAKYLILMLGKNGYGIYILFWTLILGIEQIEKSMQTGAVKNLAIEISCNSLKEINKIASTSLVLSIIILSIICLLSFYLIDVNNIEISVIIIAYITLIISTLCTPYISIVQGSQNYIFGSVVDVTSKYISIALIYIIFQILEPNLSYVLVIVGILYAITKLSFIPKAYFIMPGLQIKFSLASKEVLLSLIQFGLGIIAASFCLVFNNTGMRWLVKYYYGLEAVSNMALILMPTLIMASLSGQLTMHIMPKISSFGNVNKYEVKNIYINGTRYMNLIMAMVLIFLSVTIAKLYQIWLGKENEYLSEYAYITLVFAGLMQTTWVAHNILKGLGKVKTILIIYFFGMLFIPSIITLLLYSMKVHNAYVTVMGLWVGYVYIAIMHHKRIKYYENFNYKELINNCYFGTIILTIPMILIGIKLSQLYYDHDVMLIVIGFLLSVIFLGLWIILIGSKNEKNYLRYLLSTKS